MDIIKSILHVFKKSDNAFKVMHPETESACITDWNTGIVNTLASTGLSSIVNVLSSDSLLALLIKKVFDAMGVKYSLGQNGYVCWGALFGGVITQWINCQFNMWVTYPIALTSVYAHIEAIHCDAADENLYISSNYITTTNCYPHGYRNNASSTDNIYGNVIIIGK